jgi:osmoprotectant transport system permease protein
VKQRLSWSRVGALVVGFLVFVSLAGAAFAAPLRVGSKRDTESTLLGEITAAVLDASGVPAVYRRDLSGGTQVVWGALQKGEIDLYPEFTGTLSNEILKDPSLKTVEALRERLRPMGLDITATLGYNSSYALGMREERATALGISKISDLRSHPDLHLGFTHEFLDRADGWKGLRHRYQLPQPSPRGFEHELSYRAIADGNIDLLDAYTTDAELEMYHLVVLEDDLEYFPKYEPLVLYRIPLSAEAREALSRIEGRLSLKAMVKLTRGSKIDKAPEDQLAARFVETELGMRAQVLQSRSRWAEIGDRTFEHLALVGASLFLAILISLPLGIAAQRRRRFGELILGGLGVVQTIPSLALLVFLLPVFGVGTAPAVVALFLYSLLPIVRGTATGLKEIAPGLRESAEALGLSTWEKLRRIELPLASRSILSGIKTAAVINVGTATIGALIGAGGYGQAILVGIRKDDLGTILEGAVPAAVLALVVQGVFEGLERWVVPRGLRLGEKS